eukprot:Phypoly_transcript_13641.p1 GENE.Phypoly_transcript_13641~~Phypoly_transcript_13641.p1  ORF type:complete len:347 (+),score=36.63 Phypoly_transcript_13641:78-1043(+)
MRRPLCLSYTHLGACAFGLVLLSFYIFFPSPISSYPTPVYTNKCTQPLLPPPSPYTRLPTLVLFVHSQINERKDQNTRFFLRHGLCETCVDIDFYIIINGESSIEAEIPKYANVHVVRRKNRCGDFGAWAQVLDSLPPDVIKKYKRFMFINDSVRGPFIDHKFDFLFPKDFSFVDIFASRLTEETRVIGSYINCGEAPYVGNHAHVQSMVFMMDDVALNYSRPRIKCYTDKLETVTEGEVGISKNLVTNHNINIGAMLYAYRGIDFRCNEPMRYSCNRAINPVVQGLYYGGNVDPFEVVFYKTGYDTTTNFTNKYTDWFEQ